MPFHCISLRPVAWAAALVGLGALTACGGGGGSDHSGAVLAALASQSAAGSGTTQNPPTQTTPSLTLNDLADPPAFQPLAQALPVSAGEYARHVQIAKIAGDNNNDIIYPEFCSTGGSNPALQNRDVVPITKLFDDFYFLGTYSVGQYVLLTKDGGFVLFDTMNNASDAQNITVPQLQKAGLNPSNMRAIVITHGHGDHDGGAAYLQTNYAPPTTVVNTADYTSAKPYTATIQINANDPAPRPLTIGGTTFTALATPGHTPGTTSFVLTVHSQDKEHHIAYLGGSAFPSNAASALQYLRSVESMYQLAKRTRADASINSHTFFDHSIDRILKASQDGISPESPMVQGEQKIQLSYATLRNCSAALLAQRDATAVNPLWRPTQIDAFSARYSEKDKLTLLKARVANYFDVVAGGEVTFSTPDGESCTAISNVQGIAACIIRTADRPASVSARFAGKESDGAIDLSSVTSRAPE